MTTADPAEDQLRHPRSQSAFRIMKILVGCYLGVSIATLIAIIVLRNDASIVTPSVWIRGTIVAATSLLMFGFAVRTAKGSGRAFLRLRLVSAIMVVAIVVIIVLPGTFPTWMKIEQAVCGLILLGVVSVVNGKHLRSLFTRPQPA